MYSIILEAAESAGPGCYAHLAWGAPAALGASASVANRTYHELNCRNEEQLAQLQRRVEVCFFSHSTHFSHMSEPILPISHLEILFLSRGGCRQALSRALSLLERAFAFAL